MKPTFFPKCAVGWAAVTLVLASATAARAQLVLSLPSDTLSALPGSTGTFGIVIQNQSATTTYYLNSLTSVINSGNGNGSVQESTFLNYQAAYYPSIAPNATIGADGKTPLVDVMIAQNAAPGASISGFFNLYGGTTPSAQQFITKLPFRVNIVASVPEEGTPALIGAGATLALVTLARRRAAKRQCAIGSPSLA